MDENTGQVEEAAMADEPTDNIKQLHWLYQQD